MGNDEALTGPEVYAALAKLRVAHNEVLVSNQHTLQRLHAELRRLRALRAQLGDENGELKRVLRECRYALVRFRVAGRGTEALLEDIGILLGDPPGGG